MLILNSIKNIFIHIHKTGGSSVEASIDRIAHWNDIILGSTRFGEALAPYYDSRFGLGKHSSAEHVRSTVGAGMWDSYNTWATVRNPYSRTVSLYCYIASLLEPLLQDDPDVRNASVEVLKAWLNSDAYPKKAPWTYPASRAYILSMPEKQPFSAFIRSPYLDKEPAFCSQFRQLSDSAKQLMVKKTVKLEELSASWPEICAQMKIPSVALVNVNETPKRFKKSSLELLGDPSDRQYLAAHFHDDFEVFGSSKE